MAKCILRSMPVDATPRSSRTRGCRTTTASSRSPRRTIAALARPGQFVMVKTVARIGSAAAAAVLDLRSPPRRAGDADRHLDPQQAHRRRAPRCSTRSSRARTFPCSAARPAVRAGRSAGRSLDGRRRRRPRAICDAGRGAARRGHQHDALLRRAPRVRAVLRRVFERLGVRIVLATEDGTRGSRGFVTTPLAEALTAAGRTSTWRPRPLAQRPSGIDSDQAVRLRADADDARGRAAGRLARPRLRRLARAGDGLRPRRLLQLRRPRSRRRRGAAFHPVLHRGTGVRRDTHRLGRAGTLTGSLRFDRLAHARQPAHRRERLLRLRRRVRRRRRPVVARRRRRQGTVPRANAKDIRRRASSKRRPAC